MVKRTLTIAGVLLCLMATAAAAPNVRTYVLYGQGGKRMSYGIEALAKSLEQIDPRMQVSTHEWEDFRDVARDIRKLPADVPVVIIGYSLGANATTWISNAVPSRGINLIVAYDPSYRAEVKPAGNNVRRVLLYHNNSAEPFGHGRIRGPQVETTETKNSHFTLGNSSWLHGKTRTAVEQVLEETK